MKFFSVFLIAAAVVPIHAATFLVEAEQFSNQGGWSVDTQFIETMGSPYLIAHGLGNPVADATTEVTVPATGEYRVWVRTLDWTKRLGRPDSAGRFQISINGEALVDQLENHDTKWTWQPAGTITLNAGPAQLALKDLTGYDGRADAILFSSDPVFTPPPSDISFEERTAWKIPGAPSAIKDAGDFDLVVIGGGYGGLGAAISAARMGVKVALVQNRHVLGGNGSSEVRVWAMGDLPPSEYPLSDIIREIEDKAKASPAPAEQFVDEKKERTIRAEKNITLFLNHHAYGVDMKDGKIAAVKAVDINSGELKRISGKLFSDCTGHGFLAQWSGADTVMESKGRMGMSNMWMWENQNSPVAFAEQPWMLSFREKDFPYPRVREGFGHAEWFWESGFDSHPITDLETTRDWNLLVAFSAWNGIKNHEVYAARDPNGHRNAALTWLAYVGGTRETLQILGDVVLNGEDIRSGKKYDDGTALTTWSIDLHAPAEQYKKALPQHPFISRAIHEYAVDKKVGYPIPYRALYSRNVPNLFMAGRNISVNRDALGTIRVMKTIGMMGVVVGRASALCIAEDCSPRDIYTKHLDKAKRLWKLPGARRFENLEELTNSLSLESTAP